MGLDVGLVLSDDRHYGAFVCAICQDLAGLDAYVTTQCSHVFCRTCLPPWLERATTCPTCSRDLLFAASTGCRRGAATADSSNVAVAGTARPPAPPSSSQLPATTGTAAAASVPFSSSSHQHMCIGPLDEIQPLAHRLLQRVQVRCPLPGHQNRGVKCEWRGDYSDLRAHLLSGTAHNNNNNNATTTTTTTSTTAAAAAITTTAAAVVDINVVVPTNPTIVVPSPTTPEAAAATASVTETVTSTATTTAATTTAATTTTTTTKTTTTSAPAAEPMEVDIESEDNNGAIPRRAHETLLSSQQQQLEQQQQQQRRQQQQQRQQRYKQQRSMALALAASLKVEANGQFESKQYQEACSLYSRAISVLEEVRVAAAAGGDHVVVSDGGDTNKAGTSSPTTLGGRSSNNNNRDEEEVAGRAADNDDDDDELAMTALITALYSNRSTTLFQLGEYSSCWEDCMHITQRLDPRWSAKAYLRAGRAAVQMGNLNDAQSALRRGLFLLVPTTTSPLPLPGSSSGPGRPSPSASASTSTMLRKEELLVGELLSAEQRGQTELAERLFGAAKLTYGTLLRVAPSAVPFLLGAAQADLGLGRTDSALQLSKRVLLRHPQSAPGCWVRGHALFLMEEFETGLQLMQESLRLDPDADDDIKRAYKAFRQVQRWIDAAKQSMFTRAFTEAAELWTLCINQQQQHQARLLLLPPQSALFVTLHVQRAQAYLRLKDYAKALKDCAIVLYHQEDCIAALLVHFQAYHGQGRHEAVVEELQQLFQQQGGERFGQDRRLAEAYTQADFLLRKERRVDYYQLLGVPSIASTVEIKRAYRKRSLECHPDRLPPSSSAERQQQAQHQFQMLGEGLEILCDDVQRKLYDEGYDAAAIRERIEAANRAAHRPPSYHHHHHHH